MHGGWARVAGVDLLPPISFDAPTALNLLMQIKVIQRVGTYLKNECWTRAGHQFLAGGLQRLDVESYPGGSLSEPQAQIAFKFRKFDTANGLERGLILVVMVVRLNDLVSRHSCKRKGFEKNTKQK